MPAGKARAALTLTCDEEQERPTAGKWVNPLLGLAKAKGAKLSLERFMEIQQAEIESENDHRLKELYLAGNLLTQSRRIELLGNLFPENYQRLV